MFNRLVQLHNRVVDKLVSVFSSRSTNTIGITESELNKISEQLARFDRELSAALAPKRITGNGVTVTQEDTNVWRDEVAAARTALNTGNTSASFTRIDALLTTIKVPIDFPTLREILYEVSTDPSSTFTVEEVTRLNGLYESFARSLYVLDLLESSRSNKPFQATSLRNKGVVREIAMAAARAQPITMQVKTRTSGSLIQFELTTNSTTNYNNNIKRFFDVLGMSLQEIDQEKLALYESILDEEVRSRNPDEIAQASGFFARIFNKFDALFLNRKPARVQEVMQESTSSKVWVDKAAQALYNNMLNKADTVYSELQRFREGLKLRKDKTRGADESAFDLVAYLNARLHEQIRTNMAPPTVPTSHGYLRYRTGRFARSAVVTRAQAVGNVITILFAYMNNPYDVFNPAVSASSMASQGRDPTRYIGESIRQLAQSVVRTRFGITNMNIRPE